MFFDPTLTPGQLATDLAVGDDVDAGALQIADRKPGRMVLGGFEPGLGQRGTDISRNADFDARAGEKAIFEADEKIYNAFTARASAQPSTQCIYGNGIIRVTDPGRVTGTKRKGRGNPALPVSAGSLGLAVPTTTEAASTLV